MTVHFKLSDLRTSGELVKDNHHTCWVRLSDDHIIKRHMKKHRVWFDFDQEGDYLIDDDLRPEYDLSQLKGRVQGKYYNHKDKMNGQK